MSEQKHSPLPWRYTEDHDPQQIGYAVPTILDGKGQCLFTSYGHWAGPPSPGNLQFIVDSVNRQYPVLEAELEEIRVAFGGHYPAGIAQEFAKSQVARLFHAIEQRDIIIDEIQRDQGSIPQDAIPTNQLRAENARLVKEMNDFRDILNGTYHTKLPPGAIIKGIQVIFDTPELE